MSHTNSLHYSCITITMYCACVRTCVCACMRACMRACMHTWNIIHFEYGKSQTTTSFWYKTPQCIMVQVDTDNHTDCTLYV